MKLTPDCNEVTARLWAPLHRITLTMREKIGMQIHLLTCPSCRAYQETFAWVSQTLDQVPDAPAFSAAYKMPPATRTLLKAAMVEELPGSKKT